MLIRKNDILEAITNAFRIMLSENENMEGFSFGSMGRNSDNTFRFVPGKNDRNTSTRIFNDDGTFNYNVVHLPKSDIDSINLYKIVSMDISKALKHPEKMDINYDEQSMESFYKRTALYIKRVIGSRPIDIVTYPQSSSDFNKKMVSYLLRLYPQSQGIKIVPNLLTKNPRNVYVNTEIAKSIGLTDDEIHSLQKRVEGWKQDEDLRDLRRKIQELEDYIIGVKTGRKRGRPTKEFTDKEKLLSTYKDQIPLLRKRGRDSTVDKNGNVKEFQIKSLDDRDRRSIEGLFEINPSMNGIQQKLAGKNVIVFDDNISSGATLDDICLILKRYGVNSVIPITLALIPKTIYGAHERI